jgi:hypothetical protein
MIFSENRCPPIGSEPEGMLFRIMLRYAENAALEGVFSGLGTI